ncbi:MAG: aminotransferase class I/II-fold pyridoxal phosphate-dependent enzyme [Acidobacteria bacterium]|nr:aminotransferase class I/II-fold pyridoxal phosphate-dependent enzyme [Acidobacteriota bacterium]
MKGHRFRPETEAVRGGDHLEKRNAALAQPIYQTSTFQVTDSDEQLRATSTDMFYTRYGNPTHTAVERALAELEGTDAALLFASGMCAITTTVLAVVKTGDHIVAQRDVYGGVTKFLSAWLVQRGIETTFVDTTEYDQHARAIRPNTRLLYLESPTNPTLRVVDLAKTVAIARDHDLITLIDSTFATPINQRPAEFGVDIVVHSGTKYLAGHTDLICGATCGRRDLIDRIRETRTTLGGVMDPHAAFLLRRGMKTLALRVARQNQTALQIAEHLAHHRKVRAVNYPFLEAHPQRALALKQMTGGGGVLSFEIDGTGEDARRLSESLHLFSLAPSLGGVESLVSIPVLTSHAMISPEHRQKMGVSEQLIRLSVGIENADDLLADLDQALAVVTRSQQQVAVG